MKHRIDFEYIELSIKVDGQVHSMRRLVEEIPEQMFDMLFPEDLIESEAKGLAVHLLAAMGEMPKTGPGINDVNPKFVEKYGQDAVQEYFDVRREAAEKS